MFDQGGILRQLLDVVLDIVLAPGLWLGGLLAATFGIVFYGWRGGNGSQLVRDLLVSAAGFVIGHLAGQWFGVTLLQLGQVQLLSATIGSFLALFAGRIIHPGKTKGKPGGGKRLLRSK